VSAPSETRRAERRFTESELAQASNRAAEHILTRINAGDEGERDLLNLQINTTGVYLRDPDATLDNAIRRCYQREPDEVLDWTQR
jgi:hypothetical protein